MVFNVKVEIIGGKEAARFLKGEKKDVAKGLVKGLQQAAFFMEGKVKLSVAGREVETRSVDTGRFLGSIKSKSGPTSASVFSNVNYAKFLEFGTSRLSPRSHFRNSLARNKKKIVSFLQKEVAVAVK